MKQEWIIIGVTKNNIPIVLDSSDKVWGKLNSEEVYAEDCGVQIPKKLEPAIYKMTNIKTKKTEIILPQGEDSGAGWYTFTGKFKKLWGWNK